MSRFRNALIAALALLTPAAWADTIVAWSEAARQTTCELCFFPNPLVAFVRDAAGQGRAGIPVTFSVPSQDVAFVPNAGPGPYTVLTDPFGNARLPYPGLIAARAGAFTVTATTPAAGETASFDLTVDGPPPTRIEFSQVTQSAVVNTSYAQRFVVRAFGADGQPRPNAAVVFMAVGGGASGSFEPGGTHGYGQAALFGQAVAPVFRANEAVGRGEVLAATYNPAANHLIIAHYNSAAGVASIEPTAGSTPQSARKFAVFPQALGAVARDAAGNPVEGAAVRVAVAFTNQPADGYGFFLGANGSGGSSGEFWMFTDGNGRAEVPYPLMVSKIGPLAAIAEVAGAAPIAYALEGLPGEAVTFLRVSGNAQRALVNTAYAEPWVIRALAADGTPVPNAVVQFFADPRPEIPSGLFAGGVNTLYGFSDAAGFARSPIFTANATVGAHYGSASGFADLAAQTPWVFFNYENVSDALSFELIQPIPASAPVGGTTAVGFQAKLTTVLGTPAAGAHFTYRVDPACGRFLGASTYSGVTGADGLAVSPPLEAIAPSLACRVDLTVDGSGAGVAADVHTYDPAALVLTATPASIEFHIPERLEYRVNVRVEADGLPVYSPYISGTVTTSPSGATGVISDVRQTLNGSSFGFVLTGNSRPGSYEVRIVVGPKQLVIPVRQRMN